MFNKILFHFIMSLITIFWANILKKVFNCWNCPVIMIFCFWLHSEKKKKINKWQDKITVLYINIEYILGMIYIYWLLQLISLRYFWSWFKQSWMHFQHVFFTSSKTTKILFTELTLYSFDSKMSIHVCFKLAHCAKCFTAYAANFVFFSFMNL